MRRGAVRRITRWMGAFTLMLAPLSAGAIDDVEFNAYLRADTTCAVQGQDFTIRFEVDSTAEQFNGYEVKILYDRRHLSFRTVAEGSLMTDACAERFTSLSQTDSTVQYTHVIICRDVTVDGPGVLSAYTFHADSVGTFPFTIISDPNSSFYDEGLYIRPGNPANPQQVIFHNTEVCVLDPTSDAPSFDDQRGAGLRLEAARPNPFAPATRICFELPHASVVRLLIYDVAGREVRTLTDREWTAGRHTIEWDGMDGLGKPVGSGIYFYALRTGASQAVRRMTLLR